MSDNKVKNLSRRAFLKSGAVVGGVALVSFNELFGYSRLLAQDPNSTQEPTAAAATTTSAGDDPQTILNLAATAETLACTHYHAAITSGGIQFTDSEMAYLKAALDSELQHLEFLNANGAKALVSAFYTPVGVFKDKKMFATVTEAAETAFVGAYLAAVRRLTELGSPLLAATAAQVAAIESQHLAIVRQIGESLPNNISLERTPYFNVSDAVPTLQPFLQGGDGFEGPTQYPGADAIRTAIGTTGLESVKPFTDPSAFPTATEAATAASGAACLVTAGTVNVNIRSDASATSAPVGVLRSGTSTEVDGQKMGADGKVWWRVKSGGWVRSDVVTAGDTCSAVPSV